ncbi:MAG: hypothetical protein R3C29_09425 [Dehalococcoidia bacterium]
MGRIEGYEVLSGVTRKRGLPVSRPVAIARVVERIQVTTFR